MTTAEEREVADDGDDPPDLFKGDHGLTRFFFATYPSTGFWALTQHDFVLGVQGRFVYVWFVPCRAQICNNTIGCSLRISGVCMWYELVEPFLCAFAARSEK